MGVKLLLVHTLVKTLKVVVGKWRYKKCRKKIPLKNGGYIFLGYLFNIIINNNSVVVHNFVFSIKLKTVIEYCTYNAAGFRYI